MKKHALILLRGGVFSLGAVLAFAFTQPNSEIQNQFGFQIHRGTEFQFLIPYYAAVPYLILPTTSKSSARC
ncbi:hypothetical protein [Anditalea andensis]|uniref:Uncharacterized protein n=1 Tax=Anditalea andensis TaxID=1048983 RepID=A0A074LDX6_9BACT|nr:hypothetical protein [Anditalea andensis]KEO71992.1 hypothetical protein EL17_21000 [Anditalea andensis]